MSLITLTSHIKKLPFFAVIIAFAGVGLSPAMAQPVENGFADLAERVMPSVVNISSTIEVKPTTGARDGMPEGVPPWFDPFNFFGQGPDGKPRKREGAGSGFIIDPSGIVITNHHVIDDADEVTVTLSDGTEFKAEVVGADERTDIAVLKVESDKPLPAVSFADSDNVRVGEWVLAVGNPFGLGGTVTAGIVSALGRDIGAGYYDDFIQTDAPINQGNSGGPLFNMDGDVIGINSIIISRGGGNVGIGFSIPSDLAQKVVADLQEHGKVERGWLGVGIQPIDEEMAESLGLDEPEGVMITNVMEGYPAEEAGMQSGDVVLSYNNEPTPDTRTLLRAVADTPAGTTVPVKVWRAGKEKSLSVTVGEMPEDIDGPSSRTSSGPLQEDEDRLETLGMMLVPLSDELRSRFGIEDDTDGVLVAQIDRSSTAAAKGVRRGDLIVQVEGRDIRSLSDVREGVQSARDAGKKAALVRVNRGGQYLFLAIKLDEDEE